MRISKLISKKFNISVRSAKELLRSGAIKSGKSIIKKDIEIDSLEIDIELLKKKDNLPIRYNISDYLLSKDEERIFLYKPPYMHVERHKLEDELTLSDIMNNDFASYHLLSRLDYEASGVIAGIKDGIKIISTYKKYLAIVSGVFPKSITVNKKIDANKRRKVAVLDEEGDSPATFSLIKAKGEVSLVKAELKIARRHQVRALLSFLGYPILNDKLYGGSSNASHLMLFCYEYELNGKICKALEYEEKFLSYFNNL